jgi:ABC-type multidrug transport system fused ATPase/permease subunit
MIEPGERVAVVDRSGAGNSHSFERLEDLH